jgi:dihydroorotate dehydrogenase
MTAYSRLLRPLLFRCDPERVHNLALVACRVAGRLPPVRSALRRCLDVQDASLRTDLGGLPISNPIGLAAGWDKSGQTVRLLGHLGLGFAEIGSISADLSHGNPKPRLFRLPADRAIVVYYGLPNPGAAAVARRLHRVGRCAVPLGVNIVKTNRGADAPGETDEETLEDYLRSVRELAPCSDYLTLNLSCPNAKKGKDMFADPLNIGRLLERVAELRPTLPVFLKIIPSADPAFLDGVIAQALPHGFVRGFLFNLPPGKPPWLQLQTPRSIWESMPGAVSGHPVEEALNTCIRALYPRLPRGRFQIIGVGGVFSAEDAYRKICLGASTVQIYTGMVYEGLGVVRRINQGLVELLRRDGFTSVREAVGTAHVSPG